MKSILIALALAGSTHAQWDQVSDATKLQTVIASSSMPIAPTVTPQPAISRKAMNVWYVSQYSLIAANALDVHSSWGKYELNPVLKNGEGKFGMQGLLIKSAICAGFLGYQHLVYHKFVKTEAERKKFVKAATIANFALTGVFTGIAARNYTIPKP